MKSESKPIKIDRRLTGSNIIDEPLQQVNKTIYEQLNTQMNAFVENMAGLLNVNLCETLDQLVYEF